MSKENALLFLNRIADAIEDSPNRRYLRGQRGCVQQMIRQIDNPTPGEINDGLAADALAGAENLLDASVRVRGGNAQTVPIPSGFLTPRTAEQEKSFDQKIKAESRRRVTPSAAQRQTSHPTDLAIIQAKTFSEKIAIFRDWLTTATHTELDDVRDRLIPGVKALDLERGIILSQCYSMEFERRYGGESTASPPMDGREAGQHSDQVVTLGGTVSRAIASNGGHGVQCLPAWNGRAAQKPAAQSYGGDRSPEKSSSEEVETEVTTSRVDHHHGGFNVQCKTHWPKSRRRP